MLRFGTSARKNKINGLYHCSDQYLELISGIKVPIAILFSEFGDYSKPELFKQLDDVLASKSDEVRRMFCLISKKNLQAKVAVKCLITSFFYVSNTLGVLLVDTMKHQNLGLVTRIESLPYLYMGPYPVLYHDLIDFSYVFLGIMINVGVCHIVIK